MDTGLSDDRPVEFRGRSVARADLNADLWETSVMDRPTSTVPMANMSILIVLAAVVGGWILSQPKLESGRPPEVSVLEDWAFGDENIKARLWVDPFAAVQRHIDKEKSKKAEAYRLSTPEFELSLMTREAMKSRGGTIDFDGVEIDDLRIIPAMVDGGTYRESGERRLRTRYAVVSALGVAGYVPKDVEHIGYLSLDYRDWVGTHEPSAICAAMLNSSGEIDIPDENALIIPFEWFRRSTLGGSNGERSEHVLVLWLRDNAFGDCPLWRLRMLIHELEKEYGESTGEKPDSQIADLMSIIGPATSETLIAMVTESISFEDNHLRPNRIKLYSPWSTAPEPLLLQRARRSPRDGEAAKDREVKSVAEALEAAGVDFIRTVCSDDQLMDRLVDELELRGVDLGDSESGDHVVLISELDRFYGRAMPVTFAAAIDAHQHRDLRAKMTSKDILSIIRGQESFLEQWAKTHRPHIHHFNYLRGVDRGSADDITETGSASLRDGETQAGKKNRVEQPFGPGQVDYVRRLARRIVELDRKHKQTGEGRVKAIGVLGGDVYDKILILQALRSEFSGTIFFTTDLDARLIHPDQYQWTRNLVIASSYGLRLSETLWPMMDRNVNSNSVPPFREGYQTAVFFSCLDALGEIPDIGSVHENTPQLFEVARSGAYDITFDEDKRIIHPPRKAELPNYTLIWFGFLALVLAIFLVLLHSRTLPRLVAGWGKEADSKGEQGTYPDVLSDYNKCYKHQFYSLLILVAVGVALVLLFRRMLETNNQGGTGEPFALFEGISIWPTEIIRALVVLLGGYFLISGNFRIQRSNIQLAWEFGVSGQPKPPMKRRSASPNNVLLGIISWTKNTLAPRMRNMFTPFWRDPSEELGEEKVIHATELWPEYNKRGKTTNRIIRISVLVVLYLMFGRLLISMSDDPHVPFRGPISGNFDTFILITSVIMTVTLTFFVVDATILCNRFIKLLALHRTEWPPETKISTQISRLPNADAKKWKKIADRFHTDWYGDWLDINMIAERTKAIGRLIIYPFLLLFFMILSRNSYFDAWDWPIALILILGIMLSYAIYCAFSLRRAAESARKQAIIRLKDRILHVMSGKKEDEANRKDRVDKIKLIIERIQLIRTGAFAPLTQHPILAALALPLGGVGTLALIDMLATM